MQIAVIAKEPTPGRVKTRLCPPFTPSEAAELARAALADTLRVVRSARATRRVLVLDGRPGPWLPSGFDVLPQRGDGLAARLAAAFDDCLRGCSEPVVLVGMDTPQLTTDALEHAGSVLQVASTRDRAVLGPADDGGYWLLGLTAATRAVFDGVGMSEPTTGAQQLRRLEQLGYEVTVAESMRDVDTVDDAAAVAELAPHGMFATVYRERAGALVPAGS